MSHEIVRFGFVIEGKGEVDAVPVLVRRICHEIVGFHSIGTTRPVRVTKSKLLREGELERAVRLASIQNGGQGPVLVVLDADDDCPAQLGPRLKSRGTPYAPPAGLTIVIPKYEFETWFLTAAQSLSGRRGLLPVLVPPPQPETVRGAKEWLTRNMESGQKYSASIDQAALVGALDLNEARCCPSFDRLCREIARLVDLFSLEDSMR